ncbi:MAG: PIN domain-containing protein [Anaerolineae bacterium]
MAAGQRECQGAHRGNQTRGSCNFGCHFAELWYGASYSAYPEKNHRAVLDFASGIGVLDLSSASALNFGDLKAHLRRIGMLMEDLDLLIAATALAHNLILVTNNTQHFGRVPELSLENWTTEP